MRVWRKMLHPRLRAKLIIGMVLAACAAMAVQFSISYQRVEANLGTLEAERMSEDLVVARGALDQLRFSLERAVTGSSVSDQLAAAAGEHDRRWLREDVVRLARTYAAQSVTVYDAQARRLAVAGLMLPDLPRDTAITQAQAKVVVSKYMYTNGGLWLVASAPIFASDFDDDVKGVLVLAQLVDNSFAGIVKGLVNDDVTFLIKGHALATTDKSLATQLEQRRAVAELSDGRGLVFTGGFASRGSYLGVDGTEGLIIVSNVRAPISAAQTALRRAMLFAFVPAVALACIVALVLSARLGRPLRSLRGAVNAIAFGDLAQRVTTGGDDEIADLGRAFNAMAERVAIAQETLRRAAVRDSLTGLLNHREFYRRLTDEIARCERGTMPLSVMMIDIDHFKLVNDTYGHQRGDAVLRDVASLVTRCVREEDVAARYAGDEFAIILPGAAEGPALRIAERIMSGAASVVAAVDTPVDQHVTLSIGLATRWPGEHSATRTVALADEALYRAKDSGRDLVVVGGDVAAV